MKACALCGVDAEDRLCVDHLDRLHASGEGRRIAELVRQWKQGELWVASYLRRWEVAMTDHVRRVQAERRNGGAQ